MNKDYKKLRNVILVLLILLAVLILANNGMLPSVKISRDDNSGYFVDMGDGGMEFEDEDEYFKELQTKLIQAKHERKKTEKEADILDNRLNK